MGMDIATLLISTFVVGLPALAYYIYWYRSSIRKKLTKEEKKLILEHTKKAYIIIALVVVYIPVVLLYFLYSNVLRYFPFVWELTLAIFILMTIGFEIMNVLNYFFYEKERLS